MTPQKGTSKETFSIMYPSGTPIPPPPSLLEKIIAWLHKKGII
jgi:hypothetical protein